MDRVMHELSISGIGDETTRRESIIDFLLHLERIGYQIEYVAFSCTRKENDHASPST